MELKNAYRRCEIYRKEISQLKQKRISHHTTANN